MTSEKMPDERALLERAHNLEMDGREAEAFGIVGRILQTNPNNVEASHAFARLQRTMPAKSKPISHEVTPPSNHDIRQLVRQNQTLMQQVQQQASPTVVRITNQNVGNQAATIAPPSVLAREERNNAAFIVGVIAGVFGLLGLAHLFNGKVGTGLALVFLGTPLYAVFWLAVLATGIGFFAIPLHFVVIWQNAKRGAAYA